MTSPVRLQSKPVAKMGEDWKLLSAVLGGTDAMRAASTEYLPRWPAEDGESYALRLKIATLFPAYERTVSVLSGKPFSKPLTIGKDVPLRVADMLDDCDLQGSNLHTFAAELAREALAFGVCGILVDVPPNPGARTVDDERRAGIRPYLVHIRHNGILGWKTKKIGSALQLSQLRLFERIEEDDGEFGTKLVDQVRVLEPGKWATWRKTKDADDDSWAPYQSGPTTLDVIPFVPVYGRRDDFMVGTAPMIELAHANVEHWQSKSDQQNILHVARVPILFGKDLGTDTNLTVGANVMVKATSKDADLSYVEHSGAAIEAGRQSLLDLEDRMRQIGAELLVIKPGKATTVQVMAENEQGSCDLQRIMQGLETALDQTLALMGKWIGEEKTGHVTIFSDFGVATLAEASAQLLFEMWGDGSLSHETLLKEMQRRAIISPDVDVKKEIEAAKADSANRDPQRKENINI